VAVPLPILSSIDSNSSRRPSVLNKRSRPTGSPRKDPVRAVPWDVHDGRRAGWLRLPHPEGSSCHAGIRAQSSGKRIRLQKMLARMNRKRFPRERED